MPRSGAAQPPKKQLGQHFLIQPEIIDEIIYRADFKRHDVVLEIGPGNGALTFPLARQVDHVVAVEKDSHLTQTLVAKLAEIGIQNVSVINQDILNFNIKDIQSPPNGKIQVIGNLPYNISTPFLEKLIWDRHLIGRSVLMFQFEVAERLTSPAGTKRYGAMTVLVGYQAQIRRVLTVSKEAFFPRPKVNSMVLELDFEKPYGKQAANTAIFKMVVKGAFTHRRKTLINSLKRACPSWHPETLIGALKTCRIDANRRAETLHMDEFICLSDALSR